MKKRKTRDRFEALWKLTTGRRKPVFSVEDDREPEGTYTNGFRNDIETWMRGQGAFTIQAAKIRWQKFSLAADESGTRRELEIRKGKRLVFKATEEGAGQRQRFGPAEIYEGTDELPAKPWQITEGKIPPSLERMVS